MARARTRSATAVAEDRQRARVRLLGGFGLREAGEERGSEVPARARTLVAYLAAHPGTAAERQRLAFLMWPDSSEGQARTNLRNLVHHLRRAWPSFDSVVEVTPSSLRWREDAPCDVDLIRFLDALDVASRADPGSPQQVAGLRAAVHAYTGDLLAGTYEEWLDEERGRLRERYVEALHQLASCLLEVGSAAEGVHVARELVRREPLAEDHHRLLMSIHAAAGDRAGAVRAYHDCVAVLRQELGVEPSADTVGAYRRLVDPEPAIAASPPTPAMTEAAATAPLVGRREERTALLAAWGGVRAGIRPHLVLVTGEPGIGKTRLVEDLAAECVRQGAAVAKARSYSGEGALGYGIVTDWLRTPELAAAVASCADADRADLARLLPEIAGDVRAAAPEDEIDRSRLFAAVARALSATSRPLLLVADDVHWADESSLQLVHYLLRSLEAPVLVAATARHEALDDDHPLTTLLRSLQLLDRATVLQPERLTSSETAELAAALGRRALDARAVADLHRETEGNPLFVVEAVRAGWDTGSTTIDLSPKLQAVIAARLAQLSDGARAVAGLAATVGRAFGADLLRSATGMSDVAVVQALDELWRRGVVESHEPAGYDFTHGKLRDAAYAGLSPAVRARNHLQVARALEATVRDVGSVSGLVASHLDRAGHLGEAVEWYREAAAEAIRLGSHVEAVRLLDRARALAATLPRGESLPAELALLSLFPAALGGIEGYASDRLAEVQQRATAVAASLGRELDPPMLRSLVMSSLCRDEFDEAGAAAERLLAAGVASRDEGLEIEAGYLLGITAFWSGRLEEAAVRFEDVVARFDPGNHPEHVVRFGHDPRAVCLSRLGNTLWLLGRPDQAVAARERALALADGTDDIITVMTVRIFTALLALDLDDIGSFRQVVLALDARDRGGAYAIKTAALRGYLDVLDGRAASGIGRIEAAVAQCGGRNLAPGFHASLLRVLVAAHALAGDPATGVATTDHALDLGGTPLWLPEVRRLRAMFLLRLRRPPEEISAELDRAAAAAAAIGAAGHIVKIDASRDQLAAV